MWNDDGVDDCSGFEFGILLKCSSVFNSSGDNAQQENKTDRSGYACGGEGDAACECHAQKKEYTGG